MTQRTMYAGDALYAWRENAPNRTRAIDIDKWVVNQGDLLALLGALPEQRLTILDGTIAPESASVRVDTEGGAPADELTAIAPGNLHAGMIMALTSTDPARVITVKNSSSPSGIQMMDAKDMHLNPEWPLLLRLVSTDALTFWQEIPGGRRAYDAIVPPDGVTIKAVDGKLEARTFTAPTADKAGTAGIVPGPPATPPSELLENVLAADAGWMGFSRNTLVQNKRTGGRELVPGVEWHSPGSVDINAVMSGRHWCREWKNAPGADASGLMEAYQLFDSVNNKWGGIQTFVNNGGEHFWRGTRGDDAPVGSPIEYGDWIRVGMPTPRMAAGVGQMVGFSLWGNAVTVPPGGTWILFFLGYTGTGAVNAYSFEFLAGGTIYTRHDIATTSHVFGWMWRIA